jgi:hypothetical protein
VFVEDAAAVAVSAGFDGIRKKQVDPDCDRAVSPAQ